MWRRTALLGATLIVCGCANDGPDGPVSSPGGAKSISISYPYSDPMTSSGDTRTAVGVVLDAMQNPVSPAPTVSWSTSAPTVATVTTTGPTATITAVDDGTAIITAESGSARGTITVTVRRRLASVQLVAPSRITLGFDAQLRVVGFDARQREIPGLTDVTYSSNNPTTVIVSPTGVLTTLFQFPQTLTATVTATATKDGQTVSDSAGITVLVPSRFDFAALMLSDYVPPPTSPSRGAGIGFFFRDGAVPSRTDFLQFLITWSALSGPATSVRLRGPVSQDGLGDVLVDIPLTLVPQTANHGTILGLITASDIRPHGGRPAIALDSLITLLGNRSLHLEVGTAANPGAEIRGPTVPF
jgi:hypothetical protein